MIFYASFIFFYVSFPISRRYRLNLLKHVKYKQSICSLRNVLLIYKTFTDVVWYNCLDGEVKDLEDIQVIAARIKLDQRIYLSRPALYDE